MAANTPAESATPVESKKRPQVNTTLDQAVFDRLNDIRFERRADKLQDVVREAVVEFVDKYTKPSA